MFLIFVQSSGSRQGDPKVDLGIIFDMYDNYDSTKSSKYSFNMGTCVQ